MNPWIAPDWPSLLKSLFDDGLEMCAIKKVGNMDNNLQLSFREDKRKCDGECYPNRSSKQRKEVKQSSDLGMWICLECVDPIESPLEETSRKEVVGGDEDKYSRQWTSEKKKLILPADFIWVSINHYQLLKVSSSRIMFRLICLTYGWFCYCRCLLVFSGEGNIMDLSLKMTLFLAWTFLFS